MFGVIKLVVNICHKVSFLTAQTVLFNPVALRKAKIVYNFGLSECNRVNNHILNYSLYTCSWGLSVRIQSNFNGLNIFVAMKACSRWVV